MYNLFSELKIKTDYFWYYSLYFLTPQKYGGKKSLLELRTGYHIAQTSHCQTASFDL